MTWEREMEVARRVARGAGEIALEYAARGVEAEDKPDHSPVTAADRASEAYIASKLLAAFPEDGLLGEEGGRAAARSGRRWIVDPIDGTRDFLRGVPTWGILIALEAEGEVTVGVCRFPAQGQTYHAVRGGGAFADDRPIRVSAIREKSRAALCLTGFNAVLGRPFAPRLLDRDRGLGLGPRSPEGDRRGGGSPLLQLRRREQHPRGHRGDLRAPARGGASRVRIGAVGEPAAATRAAGWARAGSPGPSPRPRTSP